MADDKSLTENCVPWVFLSVETQEAMKFAKHGWLYWSGREWLSVRHPLWWSNTIYRAKPSPEIHARYINLYGELGPDQACTIQCPRRLPLTRTSPAQSGKLRSRPGGQSDNGTGPTDRQNRRLVTPSPALIRVSQCCAVSSHGQTCRT